MKPKHFIVGICLALLATVATASEKDFYKGKTVDLVVGYGPGGGFDTLARLIAPEFEKRTGATVVVRNTPGGGGAVALNQVANGKPDGLTLMLVNGQAAVLAQLLSDEAVRYDLTATPTIGLVSPEPAVVLVGKDAPYKSIADMLAARQPVKWAAGSKIDNMADIEACLSEALQLKSKIIIGYKGSNEAALSVMRGETDAITITASSGKKFSQDGQLIPIAIVSRQRNNLLPDVPTIFELVKLDDAHAWWIDFRANLSNIGRYLVTTPGTPPERVDYLVSVVKDILTDKAFLEYARSKKAEIEYAEIEHTNGLIRQALKSLSKEQLEQVRHVLLEKYY
ncbi:MAG: Bug family tripartite tricarboxylate transporter substrate binding protein [Thermodesulfobacteriota bacterium]